MNNMTVNRFLYDSMACTEGQRYAHRFGSMYEVYESLLNCGAGGRSFEWALWAFLFVAESDSSLKDARKSMGLWFFEALRPVVGDEAIDSVIAEAPHNEQSRLFSISCRKEEINNGVFSSHSLALRASWESWYYATQGSVYAQGLKCLRALAMMRVVGDPRNPALLKVGTTAEDNYVHLLYPGEDKARIVELITPEIQAPFLAKLRELGNPFKPPETVKKSM